MLPNKAESTLTKIIDLQNPADPKKRLQIRGYTKRSHGTTNSCMAEITLISAEAGAISYRIQLEDESHDDVMDE